MVALSDRKIEIVRTLVQSAPDKIVGGLRAALQEATGDTVLASVRQLVEAEAQDRALRNAIFAPIAPLCVGDGKSAAGVTFPAQALALIWRGVKASAPAQIQAAVRAQAAAAAAEAAEQGHRPADPGAAYNAVVATARAALDDSEQREFRAAAELCDAARPGGAAAFAAGLDIAPIVRRAIPRLHDWTTHSGGEVGAAARLAYKDSVAISPDAGPLFFEMLAGQLDPPWLVLRIISAVMDKPNERYLADSELSGFPERVLDAIDGSLKAIGRMDLDGGPETGRATGRLAELVTQQTFEVETWIELSRDHGWGKRLHEQKLSLASLVEGRLKEAEKLVAAALPMESSGFGRRRSSGPKLDAAPSPRDVGRALTALHFAHEVRLCANYGGFSAAHAKITEKLAAAIEGYVEEVLDHARTGDVPDLMLARDHLYVAADLIGLVRDEKATELVRRRAASTCASQEPPHPGEAVVLDA
ncbi:hypothetical protein [Phenylobacterium sp.]|jgi:hypothetical protein|uniref:hypothetical protein n=1 Tax=Phenylobacterium sp. TaxID=1871053 RepID=UPI002F400385